MITLWLMGGFGNVLFQLFMGQLLRERGHSVGVCDRLVRENNLTRVLGWTIHDAAYRSLVSPQDLTRGTWLAPALAQVSRWSGRPQSYAAFVTDPRGALVDPPRNLFGYHHDRRYLEENQVSLMQFAQSVGMRMGEPSPSCEVAVHFRGGDSGWARLCEPYYREVRSRVQSVSTVLVVTDSPEQADTFFRQGNGGPQVKIVSNPDPLTDFRLLAGAGTLYSGPSTFSWWAAHSGRPHRRKVLFPRFLADRLGVYLSPGSWEAL